MRALVERVFFWFPGRNKVNEQGSEQGPDTKDDHDLILSVTSPKKIPSFRQMRYASRFLNKNEQRAAVIAFLLFLISSCAAMGFFIKQHTESVPVSGGSLTEALIGEPKHVNPLDAPANDVDRDLTSLVFSGLFRMNGMEPVPDLAEKYTWSDDGKTLTVTIRSDAYFHNGDAVIADDVQFTIDSIQDPVRTSPLAPRFRGVKAIATDDHTIQFILDNPDVSFLAALTVGILPVTKWQEIPAANARLADLNLKPIGSGPFKFKSFKRDSRGLIRSYTLERNEGYYGNKPYIEKLVFQFYPDRKQAEDALKADLVDSLSFVSISEPQKNGTSRWRDVRLELPQVTVAFFNLKDSTMSDKRLRQALDGVIDRQEIVAAWQGRSVEISEPYPFATVSSVIVTLEEGRKLLEATDWILPEGAGVRVLKSATSTELNLTIITSNQIELVAVAEALKRRWSLLGVKITIESLAPEELLRRASRERNAQIILTNVLFGPEQDMFPFWWSGQAADRGLNISGLSDRDVDNALKATRSATSTQGLEDARKELSSVIKRSVPAAFLVRPTASYFVTKKVKGVSSRLVISQPSDRFRDLTNWYIKTGLSWKTADDE